MKKPSLTIKKDFTDNINKTVATLKNSKVLVGIPSEDNARRTEEDRKESPFGNAAILAINHFGSESGHIPPRPVLTIGIRNSKAAVAEQFKKAATAALEGGSNAANVYYERAGTIAANACKKVINDQDGIQAPAESTIKARKYLTKSGFKGEKALLVTGQVRNAITYVVKGGSK